VPDEKAVLLVIQVCCLCTVCHISERSVTCKDLAVYQALLYSYCTEQTCSHCRQKYWQNIYD